MAGRRRSNLADGLIRAIWSTRIFRLLAWCCAAALAVLSLLPGEEMVRTGFPTRLEHLVAYAGSTAITVLGYGYRWGATRIIGGFWIYAGVLEYLQQFSPGRHAAIADAVASG